jgi:hypothetical protein
MEGFTTRFKQAKTFDDESETRGKQERREMQLKEGHRIFRFSIIEGQSKFASNCIEICMFVISPRTRLFTCFLLLNALLRD